MDKIICIELVLIVFVLLCHCSNSSIFIDDDDDDSPWNRCPYIRNKLKNGRVKIRNRGRIAKFVCDPGYDLAGKRFATCVRGQWNNPVPMCVARGCFKLPEVPNGRVTEMYRGAVQMFDCLPGYAIEGPSTLYCDGRHWSSTVPACVVAATEIHTSCDFEDPNLCSWTQDPSHDFDWKRNQFSTPSGHAGTGPSYDHTFGVGKGGYYLYGEASAPRKPNDVSRLFSPVYSPELSGGCFLFWYHMYGSTIGGLKVYTKPESHVFGELAPAWELFGDQGDQWLRGNVSIPKFNENFQIIIEGIRGSNYIGDTAIDDVYLSNLGCKEASTANESVPVLASNSCRGRCREINDSYSCECSDNCHSNGNCCYDFDFICTGNADSDNENPYEEQDHITTIIVIPSITEKPIENTTLSMTATIYNISTTTSSAENISLSSEVATASPIPVTISFINVSSLSTDTATQNLSVETSSKPSNISTSISTTTNRGSSIIVTQSSTEVTSPITNTTASTTTLPSSTTTTQSTTTTTMSTTTTTMSTTTTTMSTTTTLSSNTTTSPVTNTVSSPTTTTVAPVIIETVTNASSTLPTANIISEIQVSVSTLSSTTLKTENNTLPVTLPSVSSVITLQPEISSPNSPITDDNPPPVSTSTPAPLTVTTSSTAETVLETSTKVDILTNPPSPVNSMPTTSTRRTYNLRPRNRTTSTTTTSPYSFRAKNGTTTTNTTNLTPQPVTVPSQTPRLNTVPTHGWYPLYRSSTTKLPQLITTTTTVTPTVPKVSSFSTSSPAFVSSSTETPEKPDYAHASKSVLDKGQPTVAVVLIIVVAVICVIGGGVFLMRRRAAIRQSKLSDDSEMRFLSENEFAEYSDPTALDKMLTH